MQSIEWRQDDTEFTAIILDWVARIIELPGHKFAAQLEIPDGAVLEGWPREPAEFDEVERWVLARAIDLEQSGDKAVAQERLLQTLHRCDLALRGKVHPSHGQRLANIKQWVLDGTTQESKLNTSPEHSISPALNWVEKSSTIFIAGTPHGEAVIEEVKAARSLFRVNPASIYHAWLEHPSGVSHKSLIDFVDFVEAEQWLYTTLEDLDDPRLAKYYLGNIHFTLDICKSSLPGEASITELSRLEYLEMRLGEALA